MTAKLEMTAHCADFSIGQEGCYTSDRTTLRIGYLLTGDFNADPDRPGLSFNVLSQEFPYNGDCDATFYIEGYKDIDALRRYCEMVLAHFDKGLMAI